MVRPIRIEYPGAVYHVICRGNNRQAIFRDDQDRKRYLEKLSLYCQEKSVDLLCYCLLSNHLHLLVGTPDGNLSKMMQAFQTSYTLYFNKRHGRTGHVFEQRYRAMVVDKDNYLLQVSRYIHLNAVSAKMVERPQDFRWSSYGSYLKGKGLTGLRTESVLGYFSGSRSRQIRQYRDYVEGNRGEKTRNPAPEVIKQIFIGDEDFADATRRKAKRQGVYHERYSLANRRSDMWRHWSGPGGNPPIHTERDSSAEPGDSLLRCQALRGGRTPGTGSISSSQGVVHGQSRHEAGGGKAERELGLSSSS
jgi:putative transposase